MARLLHVAVEVLLNDFWLFILKVIGSEFGSLVEVDVAYGRDSAGIDVGDESLGVEDGGATNALNVFGVLTNFSERFQKLNLFFQKFVFV